MRDAIAKHGKFEQENRNSLREKMSYVTFMKGQADSAIVDDKTYTYEDGKKNE